MTITESNRHRLHQALIASLGEEEAATLMEHPPPIGWADVATKTDLEHLRVATSAEFAAVNDRITTTAAEIRAEIADRIKSSEHWMVSAVFGSTALLGTVLGVLIRMS